MRCDPVAKSSRNFTGHWIADISARKISTIFTNWQETVAVRSRRLGGICVRDDETNAGIKRDAGMLAY